jgi:hypothetical protein
MPYLPGTPASGGLLAPAGLKCLIPSSPSRRSAPAGRQSPVLPAWSVSVDGRDRSGAWRPGRPGSRPRIAVPRAGPTCPLRRTPACSPGEPDLHRGRAAAAGDRIRTRARGPARPARGDQPGPWPPVQPVPPRPRLTASRPARSRSTSTSACRTSPAPREIRGRKCCRSASSTRLAAQETPMPSPALPTASPGFSPSPATDNLHTG